MRPRNIVISAYLCGVWNCALGFAFHQDWHGLEGYTAYIQDHWVNIHWAIWIPFMIVGFAWFTYLYFTTPE